MPPHALPRRTAVAAHDRADEPPPAPAIVRLRGHELDFVVHRLPVGPVVQPKPCIVGVAEVCLVPYGGVRTVLLIAAGSACSSERRSRYRISAFKVGVPSAITPAASPRRHGQRRSKPGYRPQKSGVVSGPKWLLAFPV